jgi:uncharacterized protein
MRPEARAFLVGCDYIVHGGDIGSANILSDLRSLATLIAVKGNNDVQPWTRELRETELFRIGGMFVYAIHDLKLLNIDLKASGVRLVVSGHTHVPKVERRDGVLYLNPGSCGPRRFKLPISVGEFHVQGNELVARTVQFDVPK